MLFTFKRLVSILNGLLLFILLAALSGCAGRSTPGAELAPTVVPTAAAAPAPVVNPLGPLPDQLKFEPFPLGPDNYVLSLVQDRQGFIWFGMEDGLYRYDGYDFKAYRPEEQSQDDFELTSIRKLYEDRLGRLWAATDRGLARFNPAFEEWNWYPQQPGAPDGLNAAAITAIAEDRGGNLWIAMDGSGISRLNPESGEISRFVHRSGDPNSLASNAVTALAASRTGALWAGTRSGILERIDPNTGQFTHFASARSRLSGDSNRSIEAILEDPAGDVWLSIPGGMLGFDPEMGSFTFFSHGSADAQKSFPSSLVYDGTGNFWVGTSGAGIYRFSPRTGNWVHYQNNPNDAYSLSEDNVAGLLLDRSGILWVHFLSGWVDRFDPRAGFRSYQNVPGNPNSLSDDEISAILVDPLGNWWIGAGERGLDRFNPQDGLWTHFHPDPNQIHSLGDGRVSSLAADQVGRIWVGTVFGGLSQYDPATGQWTAYSSDFSTGGALSNPNIHALYVDSNGKVWIGADDGILNLLDPETGRFSHFPPPNPFDDPNDPNRLARAITALVEDAGGRLWVGTDGGRIYRFEPRSGSWERYMVGSEAELGRGATFILSLCIDRTGMLWIGTAQAGLFRFDPQAETFLQYSEQDGLPADGILGILEDQQGTLWVSTRQGLARFDPGNNLLQKFDVNDGLPGDAFVEGAAYRSASGELFFGSTAGLVVFYPEVVGGNPYLPPVVITDFQLFYEPVAPGADSPWRRTPGGGDEIRLGYTQNVFSFEYAALDFSNPDENQYAYLLEGFDQEWVDAGNRRQASYTNLAPGEYTFRVIGSNNAGLWNEQGASIRVLIQPPFWATGWFRLLSVGLMIGAVAGGVGLRLRAVNKQKRELQRQVEERTHELQGALKELGASREAAERAAVLEERQRLARELHDSVTQLLYGQVLTSDICYKLLKKGDLDTLGENLIRLQETSGQSLKEMRLLLYELRPSSFEEEGLVNALELRLDAVERRSRIESYLEVKGDLDLPDPVAWEIYRIAIEALNNSLKHASATQVVVRLEGSDNKVVLEVQDNGLGFEIDGAEKGGFGIRSMRQRALGIGGKLAIESKPEEGTCVRVEVLATE